MSEQEDENMAQQNSSANEVTNEPINEILPGYTTIENFTKDGYKILMEAIKHSNCLPNGRDWDFYNTDNSFTKISNKEGNAVLKQINSILRSNDIEGNIFSRALEEKVELMIEANDVILERVANNIDELNGIRKITLEPVLIQTVSAQIPVNGSWNRVNNATFSVSSSITSESLKKNENSIRLLTAKNILRPQKFFKDKIINSSKYPWEPRIKDKPNSLKPLAIFLEETENGEEYSHPYEFELDKFTPLEDQLKRETPVRPLKLEDTPLVEIRTSEEIDELVEELRNCKEFAVDLEHHSYRSFMGITCLMQISTAEKDYLIDTLALRDKLHILNEVFTKPTIVKIFHGADMDIQWLQRDLSLYVVNMFDTYQAAKQLSYSGLSLAYLMQKFCNFMPNKRFQLADWRIRPLPDELKAYAREDTHYLIYIYQMLKNELLEKANGQDNLIRSVINNSTKVCKRRYFRSVLREDSHLDFYRKCKRLFDNRQLYALKELYKWRDQISREEDESTGYVLPNHMLLQISESLPREMQGILACCNPIPPLVRANLLELHQIILRAKEQPLEKPIMKEDTRARGTTQKISKINVDSPLHCPHDLTRSNEFRDDLSTLIGGSNALNLMDLLNRDLGIEHTSSSSSVFDTPDVSEEEVMTDAAKKIHEISFLSPFERYKLVKPFIQAEEQRLAAEESARVEVVKETVTTDSAVTTDDRTDEERIESIRKHFLDLARKTVPGMPPAETNQTLVEMGGTKKRKRESSPENDRGDSQTDLQTTVPNLGRANKASRKRKSKDLPKDESPNKIQKQTDPKQKFFNKVKKRNRNKQKRGQNSQNFGSRDQNDQTDEGNQISDNHTDPSESTNHPNFDYEQDSLQSDTVGGRNKQNFRGQPNQRRGNFRNRRRGNKQQNVKPSNDNRQFDMQTHDQDFEAYDYSSVDFRQFQGGAQPVQRQQQFKSNFKLKGRRRGRGNNNRSATFGNGGKRGR